MKSNQFPVNTPKTAKNYALYAGPELKLKGVPYPVLVVEKRKLEGQGIRFLTIKAIKP